MGGEIYDVVWVSTHITCGEHPYHKENVRCRPGTVCILAKLRT